MDPSRLSGHRELLHCVVATRTRPKCMTNLPDTRSSIVADVWSLTGLPVSAWYPPLSGCDRGKSASVCTAVTNDQAFRRLACQLGSQS
jgi:hypothetical protein